MPKRKASDGNASAQAKTPKKARHDQLAVDNAAPHSPSAHATPSRSILKKRALATTNGQETPKSVRKVLFTETPSHHNAVVTPQFQDSPTTATRRVQKSARKKATVELLERRRDGREEDENDGIDRETLTDAILDVDPDDASRHEKHTIDQDALLNATSHTSHTPSKSKTTPSHSTTKRTPRQRQRTPSPPPDMPPNELYFFQNRPGNSKTSTNTLPATTLLSHEDYLSHMTAYKDPHENDIRHLERLHRRGFDQWIFELEQGFNVCLYGYGSKRGLVNAFANHVYNHYDHESHPQEREPKIVIVNGYAHLLSLKDIFTTLATHISPQESKLPAQPALLLDFLLDALDDSPPIFLLINSLDARPLRKPLLQSSLSRLASHSNLHLLATTDTLNFGLMWDTLARSRFRFAFHDTTTFAPYSSEIDVVDTVNSLLGRSGRRVGGKDGVGYVLQSLPHKARELFRILIAEQLALADESADQLTRAGAQSVDIDQDGMLDAFDQDELNERDYDDTNEPMTPSKRIRKGRPAKTINLQSQLSNQVQNKSDFEGVESRTLYHKAVEQFACSSEIDFRTLLKEFVDHQMIQVRGQGNERLIVPFARSGLEGLLETLV